MVVRVDTKLIWVFRPYFADVFIGCQALEGLEPLGKVVGHQESLHVSLQFVMRAVMVSLDRGFLDRAVHAFDLAVGPWMIDLGRAVFDIMLAAT